MISRLTECRLLTRRCMTAHRRWQSHVDGCTREQKSSTYSLLATQSRYLKACQAIVKNQGLELRSVPFSSETGCIEWPVSDLDDAAALAIAYPNFFGGLDAVDELITLAREQGALVIGVVNPTAMAL